MSISKNILEILHEIDEETDSGLLLFNRPALYRKMVRKLRGYDRTEDVSVKNIQNSLNYLFSKRFLLRKNRHLEAPLSLTNKGRSSLRAYKMKNMKLGRPKMWDHIWRLVIFDISTDKRQARNALRNMLKRMDFQQIQKSVWVIPFECESEISQLKSFFELTEEEVRLVRARDMGDMKKFIKFFKL